VKPILCPKKRGTAPGERIGKRKTRKRAKKEEGEGSAEIREEQEMLFRARTRRGTMDDLLERAAKKP